MLGLSKIFKILVKFRTRMILIEIFGNGIQNSYLIKQKYSNRKAKNDYIFHYGANKSGSSLI